MTQCDYPLPLGAVGLRPQVRVRDEHLKNPLMVNSVSGAIQGLSEWAELEDRVVTGHLEGFKYTIIEHLLSIYCMGGTFKGFIHLFTFTFTQTPCRPACFSSAPTTSVEVGPRSFSWKERELGRAVVLGRLASRSHPAFPLCSPPHTLLLQPHLSFAWRFASAGRLGPLVFFSDKSGWALGFLFLLLPLRMDAAQMPT